MTDGADVLSDSDTDNFDSPIWSFKKRKFLKQKEIKEKEPTTNVDGDSFERGSVQEKYHKFEELRKKSNNFRIQSAQKLHKIEKKRTKRLLKKALRDPLIKSLVEKSKAALDTKNESDTKKREKEEWEEVKPFLNVNSHLHGPVSHGDWGPKTELEITIEDAIKEGDFEKAELLSDTLANREFAVKIAKAYAAKREHDQLEEHKCIEKDKNAKKLGGHLKPKRDGK